MVPVLDVKGSWESMFGNCYFVRDCKGYKHGPVACRSNLQLFEMRMRDHKARRRASVRSRAGELSEAQWLTIVKRQHGRCFDCRALTALTRGHLVPLIHAKSTHAARNIIAQCRSCNSKQRHKIHIAALQRGLVTKQEIEKWVGDFGRRLVYRPT